MNGNIIDFKADGSDYLIIYAPDRKYWTNLFDMKPRESTTINNDNHHSAIGFLPMIEKQSKHKNKNINNND